jgi:hypothetical protein
MGGSRRWWRLQRSSFVAEAVTEGRRWNAQGKQSVQGRYRYAPRKRPIQGRYRLAPTVCRRRVSLLNSGRVLIAKTRHCVIRAD